MRLKVVALSEKKYFFFSLMTLSSIAFLSLLYFPDAARAPRLESTAHYHLPPFPPRLSL